VPLYSKLNGHIDAEHYDAAVNTCNASACPPRRHGVVAFGVDLECDHRTSTQRPR